jgi:GDP-mannose 6-dehydrogenase
LASNKCRVENGIEMIVNEGYRHVGFFGFAFKAGTDDLSESPLVDVIEHLIGEGYALKIYDENVNLAALRGANRDYILNRIPHVSRLMVATT